MTEKTIQFFKNVYLQMEGRSPLFNFNRSAKDAALHAMAEALHHPGVNLELWAELYQLFRAKDP